MKYKIINKTTGEESLCTKISISGFDYYVNDGRIKKNDPCIDFSKMNFMIWISDEDYIGESKKKLIATDNPNITSVPKVMDEIKVLAYNWLYEDETEKKAESGYALKPMEYGFIQGYQRSQETHPFSEVDVMDLLDFVQNTPETKNMFKSEIIQRFRELKPKVMYCQ